MDFDLSEDQTMLRDQAERLFAQQASPSQLRAALDGDEPYDTALWNSIAELGFLGIAVPEEFGGLGLSPLDLALVLQEAGRACAPIPFFSSIGLAAPAIALTGTYEQKARWLPRLAEGSAIGTFAHVEGIGRVCGAQVNLVIEDGRATGVKVPVPDASIADVAVIVGRSAHDQLVLALADLDTADVMREPVDGIDQLRRHSRLTFRNARCEIMCEGAAAQRALSSLYDIGAVLCAFEQIGGAERCLYMARDYALERKVFGQSIGAFQSIKHSLADIFCQIEIARSNAWFAAWALAEDPSEAPSAAAVARLSAIEAYEMASRENLQIHGGIGYTWEADCHFYYRRSRLLAASLGSAAEWSELLIDRIRGSILSGD